MTPRFPFPSFPHGWYVVGFSSEFPKGEVKTVHYFDRDIVLFRGAEGTLSALDATCPHLGAHLGGGKVDGNCLRCPFHGWAFGADGRCKDVPYAPKIPPRAQVHAWHLLEQNGIVLVYFGKEGDAPAWTPPKLEEQGWTPDRTIRWEIRSHPQEVGENTVDCSHLGPVHHVNKTEVLEVEQRAHVMRVLLHLVATGHSIGMPDEINDVHLDVTLQGLGIIVSTTQVRTTGMTTRQRIHPTPIDRDRIAIFAVANTRFMPDPDYTREIDEIFWQAFTVDFAKDFPIWENKAYLEHPLLASGDGPIGSYRKWARQFYAAADATKGEVAKGGSPLETNGMLLEAKALLSRIQRRTPEAIGRLVERGKELVQVATSSLKSGSVGEPTPPVQVVAKEPGGAAGSSENHPLPKRFESVEAYFESLTQRFDADAAGELEAVFQWTLTGNKNLEHFAEVKGGTIQAAPGVHEAPTLSIEMNAEDYLLMINGELNGALAFSTGRGRLRGPVRLAMRMQRIFPLDN